MEPIEFRAWDEGSKVMHYDFQFIKSGDEENDWIIFISDKYPLTNYQTNPFTNPNPYFAKQLKIMQYTGLKDKNDKKIYVGDILQIETADHEIINVTCKFGTITRKLTTGWDVEISCFYFERPDGLNSLPIANNWAGKRDLEIMEVIGNIYEGQIK